MDGQAHTGADSRGTKQGRAVTLKSIQRKHLRQDIRRVELGRNLEDLEHAMGGRFNLLSAARRAR